MTPPRKHVNDRRRPAHVSGIHLRLRTHVHSASNKENGPLDFQSFHIFLRRGSASLPALENCLTCFLPSSPLRNNRSPPLVSAFQNNNTTTKGERDFGPFHQFRAALVLLVLLLFVLFSARAFVGSLCLLLAGSPNCIRGEVSRAIISPSRNRHKFLRGHSGFERKGVQQQKRLSCFSAPSLSFLFRSACLGFRS